jgi:hypothetical protein
MQFFDVENSRIALNKAGLNIYFPYLKGFFANCV